MKNRSVASSDSDATLQGGQAAKKKPLLVRTDKSYDITY